MRMIKISSIQTGQRSAREHFDALDGMRALAAYGVVATHTAFASGRVVSSSPWAPFLARLDFGVTLFFLLSGFLLYRPFASAAMTGRPAPDLGRFYLRRAARILPPYWVAVVVTLAVISDRPAVAGDWASYLTLTQTYNDHNVDPSLTQMWTLAVEISFYAILPLLAWFARGSRSGNPQAARRQLTLIGVLVAIAVAADIVGHRAPDGLRSLLWLPANLDWFAAGMFLAVVSALPAAAPGSAVGRAGVIKIRLREFAMAPGTCWLIGMLLFWLATLPLGGPRDLTPPSAWEWTIKHWLYSFAAFALLMPLVLGDGGVIGRLLSTSPMKLLGELSYGVYLWHLGLLLAIQRALGQRTFGGHFWQLYLLTAVSATVVAGLSWFGFERRLMLLAHRVGSTPAAATNRTAAPQRS